MLYITWRSRGRDRKRRKGRKEREQGREEEEEGRLQRAKAFYRSFGFGLSPSVVIALPLFSDIYAHVDNIIGIILIIYGRLLLNITFLHSIFKAYPTPPLWA